MARRGQNEGSIYKRTDGRWAASLTLGYHNGKRKRKTFYGKTRREVQEHLTAALRTQQQGLPIVAERQTVAQYLTAWLVTAQPTVEPTTWERYEIDVRRHLIPVLGRIQLAHLTPQQIQQLFADKLNDGLSPRSVRNVRAVLRRALNEALQLGLIPRNVASLVRAPKMPRGEMQVFDAEQTRQLLEAARADRLEALFVLAVSTGMRQGELLGLRWRNVNLDGRYVQVQSSLKHTVRQGLMLRDLKTASSRRKIVLTSAAVEALRRHRVRQREERLSAGPLWQDQDLVFCNHHGGFLYHGNVLEEYYKPIVRRAGLPYIRFHDLRHTAATLMLLQGAHPKVVSEMLGHASVVITLSLYSHVLPDMQQEAVGRMDALLSGGG